VPQSIKWLSTITRERWIRPDSESGGIPHLFGTSIPPYRQLPDGLVMTTTTRMVQLPATAAIEYVAAPGGTFSPRVFCPGALLVRGTFGRGDLWPGVLLSGGVFWPGGIFVRGAFVWGVFCPGALLAGGLLSGGLMPVPPKFNAYTHRLGFLCLAL